MGWASSAKGRAMILNRSPQSEYQLVVGPRSPKLDRFVVRLNLTQNCSLRNYFVLMSSYIAIDTTNQSAIKLLLLWTIQWRRHRTCTTFTVFTIIIINSNSISNNHPIYLEVVATLWPLKPILHHHHRHSVISKYIIKYEYRFH